VAGFATSRAPFGSNTGGLWTLFGRTFGGPPFGRTFSGLRLPAAAEIGGAAQRRFKLLLDVLLAASGGSII
jgi:hypothetical protein